MIVDAIESAEPVARTQGGEFVHMYASPHGGYPCALAPSHPSAEIKIDEIMQAQMDADASRLASICTGPAAA